MLVKITLTSLTFKFYSSFLVLFINFFCKIKNMNLFEHSLLREKQPPRTYLSIPFSLSCWKFLKTFLCCKQDSWKNLTSRDHFWKLFWLTVLNSCTGPFQSIYQFCENLFFMVALIGCFFKKRILTTRSLLLIERLCLLHFC